MSKTLGIEAGFVALDNAGPRWRDRALKAVTNVPRGVLFTADALYDKLPPCPGDGRAMGAVLVLASRQGLIERMTARPNPGDYTDTLGVDVTLPVPWTVPSTRPGCHGSLTTVWRRL